MFSNSYIFKYSAAMVILVAAILAAAAIVLQPAQERNVKVEKIQDMLASANIVSTPANAEGLYNEHVIREIVINEDGEELSVYSGGNFAKGNQRAFDVDVRSQLKVKADAAAGKTKEKPVFPLFVVEKEKDTFYIIPLQGNGLWGPVWGNMTLKSDFATVEGVTFGHKGETPGLGAEISTPVFEDQFPGKKILDDNGQFTSIKVIKGGVKNSSIDPVHGVDAISGGTITSMGVNAMIENNLSNYINYIKNHRK
ncbi:MAG TPA: NADH:ubiquinone reductase (Na(+)-transporting) subunit C [Lentimicrobium sp.]|nr:NADH:ubiquinone reductase (Na(+)-transporting) subunit C [Lentimicrobium sp.]